MIARRRLTIWIVSALLMPGIAAAEGPTEVDYTRDIRPILAEKCYACHGPDEAVRKAELRLDSRSGATGILPSGNRAIVPGAPDEGQLIRRITSRDPSQKMPPPDAGKDLTDTERKMLQSWLSAGAPYQTHWAFVAPRRAELPPVQDPAWPLMEIDAFIKSRLEKQNLTPAAAADRETLLRRLSLDLRGLPPTLREIDQFLADRSDDAYEHAVDRMLGSKHFGEKLAQDWLDLARYGDTNGYHNDSHRDMWLYRDWVIYAFNTNMPFDRFVVDQIAGDLIPEATPSQHIASGFNRNAPFNEEGGADPDEFYAAYAIDRANTTGQALMGLTVGCAQCHSHKYDPISQKEYYQLFAFFNSVDGEIGGGGENGHHGKPVPPVYAAKSPLRDQRLAEMEERIRVHEQEYQRELERHVAALDADQVEQWAARFRGREVLHDLPSVDGLVLRLDAGDVNGNRVADAEEPFSPPATVSVWHDASGNGHDAPASGDPQLVPDGLGGLPVIEFDGVDDFVRTPTGGQKLSVDFTMVAVWRIIGDADQQMLVMWGEEDRGRRRALWYTSKEHKFSFNGYHADVLGAHSLVAQDSQIGVISKAGAEHRLTLMVNGEAAGDGTAELQGYSSDAITVGANNVGKEPAAAQVAEVLLYDRALNELEIGRVGEYLSSKYSIESKFEGLPRAIAEIAQLSTDEWSERQRGALERYYVQHVGPQSRDHLQSRRREIAERKSIRDRFRERKATTMVMKEMPQRKPAHVLMRGDFQQPGEKVEPDVPQIFPALPAKYPRNRLALAHWLVLPDHPLVSRVRVNHLWKLLFGTGLVRTAGDFGTQGEAPSHPKLLDWLAVEFVESGWDTKALIKQMVMSATYRQRSVGDTAMETDPENRYLYRAPRYRLRAEEIRDMALTVSGLIDRTLGGPSVRPFQPAEYFSATSGKGWRQSSGDDAYRRGLYTYWQRTAPYPSFVIFDAPSRQICTARRPRTNTPLQALVTMNDPVFVEAARALGEQTMKDAAASTRDRVKQLFRRVLTRSPQNEEMEMLLQIHRQQRSVYEEDQESAAQVVSTGARPRDPSLDVQELAAWTNLASVVLNLDEAITRE